MKRMRARISNHITFACWMSTIWYPTTLPFPVFQSLNDALTESVAFTIMGLITDKACVSQEQPAFKWEVWICEDHRVLTLDDGLSSGEQAVDYRRTAMRRRCQACAHSTDQ